MKRRLKGIVNRHNRFVYISYVLITIAVILLIISFLPASTSKNTSLSDMIIRNSKTTSENSIVEESSSSVSTNTFVKNGNAQISQLIEKYYGALMANDDTKLSKYTDSVQNIDPLKRKINAQYIESYPKIDCYVMPGILPGTYIVVVVYQVKYKDIATITSYLDYFYVSTDLSGNIYITNKAVSEEISSYNRLMYESNIIKQLEEAVAKEYDAALKNDQQLAEFVNGLQ